MTDSPDDPIVLAGRLGATADATRTVARAEQGETRELFLALASSLDALAADIRAAAHALRRTTH